MKRTLTLCLFLIGCVGCANRAATAPVPGSLNSTDAAFYRVLYDAQAALNQFRADVVSGKVTETPTLKATFNQATTDYNAAESVFQIWRAAGASSAASATAPVSQAITKFQGDVTAIAAQAGGK